MSSTGGNSAALSTEAAEERAAAWRAPLLLGPVSLSSPCAPTRLGLLVSIWGRTARGERGSAGRRPPTPPPPQAHAKHPRRTPGEPALGVRAPSAAPTRRGAHTPALPRRPRACALQGPAVSARPARLRTASALLPPLRFRGSARPRSTEARSAPHLRGRCPRQCPAALALWGKSRP